MAPGVCESLFTPVLHPPPFTHPSTCSSAIDPPSHPPFIHLPGRTAAFTSPIPLPARLRPAALRPPALSGPPFRGHTRFPPSTGLGARSGRVGQGSEPSALGSPREGRQRLPTTPSHVVPLESRQNGAGLEDLLLRSRFRRPHRPLPSRWPPSCELVSRAEHPHPAGLGALGGRPSARNRAMPRTGSRERDPSVSCGPWNSPVPPHTWPVDRYDPVADAEGGLGGGGVRARWPCTWHLGSRLCSTPSVLSCPGAASWLCPGDTSGSCSGISPEWPLGKCRGDCPELPELSFKSQQS